MDATSATFPRSDIRVSDAERDQAVAELSGHFQAGRLTQDEFDDRSGLALSARTGADLGRLFTDLPRPAAPAPAAFPAAEAEAEFVPGGPPRPNLLPLARAIIAFMVAAVIAGGLVGGRAPGHHIRWLIPVLLLTLVFLRLARRRR